ncbi:MAG: hypothetical protein CI948_1610, partial [Halanaerobium sp.]
LNKSILIAVFIPFKMLNDKGKYWFQVGVKNFERRY